MPRIAKSTTGVKHEVRPENSALQKGTQGGAVCYCGYKATSDQIEKVDDFEMNTCNNCSSIRKGERSKRYQ